MVSTSKKTQEQLWDYCITFYGKGDVKKHCLLLQKNIGADVNMILLLCWLFHKGYGQITATVMAALYKVSNSWQREILKPMRQVRKQIGHIEGREAGLVYKFFLASELKAEKAEQAVLIQNLDGQMLSKETETPQRHLKQNLDHYFSYLKVEFDEKDLNSIKYIISQT
jgi:uncharacterized protein (TIGR02444 family)